jgi:diguanylate cyclase (GGDEF)-like protein
MTLLLVDIDHFKQVNDKYGHLVGDEILFAVASVLTQQIRPSDLLARYGGEEFALILPDTSIVEAKLLAERVRAAIETSMYKLDNGVDQDINLTISVGITSLLLGDEINSLLARADQALYQAKENGRNRVEVG